MPGYIQNLSAIKAKGVDIVAVIAYNDAFVMSAWSKANGIKNDDIVCQNGLGEWGMMAVD
jgi:alkyl hydroperoxide reductase 1